MPVMLNLKRKELNQDYPTQEEYFKEIERIQNEEVKSDRYALTYAFLTNNYWNRENRNLELELLNIVGTNGLEDSIFNKSIKYRKAIRMKRYENLEKFINSLTEEQINSNILLKSAYMFMKTSDEDNENILIAVYDQINDGNAKDFINIVLPIPADTQKLIPNYINEQVSIKYYKPRSYKRTYIDVLDKDHKHVYQDYNELVSQISRLAEDIYFLKLNDMVLNNQNLECCHFQVYHPNENHEFIASFLNYEKKKNNTRVLKKN